MRACFCTGPRNGEPLCPCRMRNVTVRNGRYVREDDLGPVPEPPDDRVRDLIQRARDARASRRITDRGGIDGTVRRSDRIGP